MAPSVWEPVYRPKNGTKPSVSVLWEYAELTLCPSTSSTDSMALFKKKKNREKERERGKVHLSHRHKQLTQSVKWGAIRTLIRFIPWSKPQKWFSGIALLTWCSPVSTRCCPGCCQLLPRRQTCIKNIKNWITSPTNHISYFKTSCVSHVLILGCKWIGMRVILPGWRFTIYTTLRDLQHRRKDAFLKLQLFSKITDNLKTGKHFSYTFI